MYWYLARTLVQCGQVQAVYVLVPSKDPGAVWPGAGCISPLVDGPPVGAQVRLVRVESPARRALGLARCVHVTHVHGHRATLDKGLAAAGPRAGIARLCRHSSSWRLRDLNDGFLGGSWSN